MSFLKKLENKVKQGQVPFIFNVEDLRNNEFKESEISNITNHDKKNNNTTNKNKKDLISRKIDNVIYYSFDKTMSK